MAGLRERARALSRTGEDGGTLDRVVALLGESVLVGVADGLGAVAGAGLLEDVVDVGLDGGGADDERGGDFGVGEAGGDQLEDFDFAGGELVGERRVLCAAVVRAAATRRCWMAGSRWVWPSATARIARSISSALASLVR